jgi:dTDP-4-dehydrorhamnose 3,5-epimerase
MIFTQLPLPDARVVELERFEDERGFFARTWCRREFAEEGLADDLVQCSLSFNRRRGTLRGMHLQLPPFREAKLVRCTRGSVLDVIIDLRPDSPTFTRHAAVELTAENRKALYIPEGFAHGFQTLEDDTELFYQMSEFYAPHHAWGVRWNDPAFGVEWPVADPVLKKRDATYPDFDAAAYERLLTGRKEGG